MTDKPTKQVIVMRKDLPGTKGKLCAQAAHAAMAFMTRRLNLRPNEEFWVGALTFSNAEIEWMENSFVKICVGVDSEEELLEIYEAAKAAGLEAHLVTDAGFTVFHGVPTNTCIAIGPGYSEDIDKITGHLKLL